MPMKLTRIEDPALLFKDPAITNLNAKIDKFNDHPNSGTLAGVSGALGAPGREHWVNIFQAISKLESDIEKIYQQEKWAKLGEAIKNQVKGAENINVGGGAKLDVSPSKWIEKLREDAPPLETVSFEAQGMSGAQGAVFTVEVTLGENKKKLLVKVSRSKHRVEPRNPSLVKPEDMNEGEWEYFVYKTLYAALGKDPANLVTIWGWASIRIGQQHEAALVMELIDGKDGRYVQKLLKEAWDLGIISSAEYWSSIQYIGRVLIAVLEKLRAHGWAHNDIKPENFMVDKNTGEVIVIDFGGAGVLNSGARAVTHSYQAPENAGSKTGGAGTAASDVFTVGATFAHMTEAPFTHHKTALPNQGLTVGGKQPYETVSGVNYRTAFKYGAATAYTKQVQQMMTEKNQQDFAKNLEKLPVKDRPVGRELMRLQQEALAKDQQERLKTFDSSKAFDDSKLNSFLYDSILDDAQSRLVLKGIVSGDRKRAWEAKWRAMKKVPPTHGLTSRMHVESELNQKIGGWKRMGHVTTILIKSDAEAMRELSKLQKWDTEFAEAKKLLETAKLFKIDTTVHNASIVKKQADVEAARKYYLDFLLMTEGEVMPTRARTGGMVSDVPVSSTRGRFAGTPLPPPPGLPLLQGAAQPPLPSPVMLPPAPPQAPPPAPVDPQEPTALPLHGKWEHGPDGWRPAGPQVPKPVPPRPVPATPVPFQFDRMTNTVGPLKSHTIPPPLRRRSSSIPPPPPPPPPPKS